MRAARRKQIIIMPTRHERRHGPFRTWYFRRHSGKGFDQVAANCCLLLEDDTGIPPESELLLESDAIGQDCLQPEDC